VILPIVLNDFASSPRKALTISRESRFITRETCESDAARCRNTRKEERQELIKRKIAAKQLRIAGHCGRKRVRTATSEGLSSPKIDPRPTCWPDLPGAECSGLFFFQLISVVDARVFPCSPVNLTLAVLQHFHGISRG
jgi:hypothetical protein